MRKHFTMAMLVAAGLGASAEAALPRSSVNMIEASIYGVYTTSDPNCASGFKATVPLSATPRVVNMVSRPGFGTGPMANPVECVVMVMQNTVTMAWSPGTYTSTTHGNSDSVCDSGGSRAQTICGNGGATAVSWPADILADLASKGLTATTTCSAAPTGTEVVAVYLSTNSLCTGNVILDAGSPTCINGTNPTNNSFASPTTTNSLSGVKLTAASGKKKYKLVIDPDQIIGNQSGTCSNFAPPRFKFEEAAGS